MLELLAARFAFQTFTKGKISIMVLLRLDNMSAVAYISNLGGALSPRLIALDRDLWMWFLERNIHIIAQHLPGKLNQEADAESQS